MTAKYSICRLCFNKVEENHFEVIGEDLKEILQSVLTRIDLTVSENPVICNKCLKKLQANYDFKRKCIFIEETIAPFVFENGKLNLKEIRNQIIKSEDIEEDKNVCRLCLQLMDNDMALSDNEKEQFQQFFFEINFSLTNFVILCSTCYDLLHKYFVFVTSCLKLEQQLCNYSLDQAETKIDNAEEHVSIKLEDFQGFIKNIKEENRELRLNEELDIKCDAKDDDQRCDKNNQEIELLMKKEEFDCDIFLDESVNDQGKDVLTIFTNDSNITWHTCDYCNRTFKWEHLKKHVLTVHTDCCPIIWYKCKQCDKKFKDKQVLKSHMLSMHTAPSEINWHHCEQCDKKFKEKRFLRSHITNVHADPSKITWYHCESCGQKFKYKGTLKYHILAFHGDSSKITSYRCKYCYRKFKDEENLRNHVDYHINPSKYIWYHCEQCDKKFKEKRILKNHVLNIHTDPSEINWYQCEQCDRKFKHKSHAKRHTLAVHGSPSKFGL